MHALTVGYSMSLIKNGVCGINGSNREKQKKFSTLHSMGENILECTSTCLCCTKYDKISTPHSDV